MKTSRRFNLTARSAFASSRLTAFLIAALVFIVIPMSGQSPRLAKQSPSAISQAKAAPTDTITDSAIESDADFVSYTHAVGVSSIDEPIAIYKTGVAIFPHTGWRGMLAMGTYANGAESDCPAANPCDRIDWPGSNVTIDRRSYGRDEPTAWYGSLASGASEGSGLQYMRNRYYDPTRGQFTQADPAGLAGGLTLYGFAAGDPVNYSDPFGLRGCAKDEPCPRSIRDVMNQMVATATDLYVRALDAFNDVADLFVGAKSAITAAGLNPASHSAISRVMAAASLIAGVGGDAERVAAKLSNKQAADLAMHLGFGGRVKDAPFDSHGQAVFTNGKRFITQDVDMHLGPKATWKMFNSNGQRVGTYDALLKNRLGN
ncbi:MAG TPA: RHS repeat-associated core domain-containing protein [Gemmatimonadaceae bacterium]|jgi:RHS repeat-associated protein|nr:RHS repeat-associated core domain-containing protein [Gemmatimonadaceae bacterium]